MLGLILNVFCNRLVRCYGETVAEQVLECCGWDPADRGCAPFSVWQYYPDAAFFALVDAAHKLGHASVADLMEGLGSHFATTVSENDGWVKLVQCLGPTFQTMCEQLNNLHLHLSSGVPDMKPPQFHVENAWSDDKCTTGSLELHYASSREALGPIVEGILHQFAARFFDLEISMQLIRGHADVTCNHEVWRIKYQPLQAGIPGNYPGTGTGSEDPEVCAAAGSMPDGGKQTAANTPRRHKPVTPTNLYTMPGELFYRLHPFHFIINRHATVVQVGPQLQALLQMRPGMQANEILTLRHPYVDWTWKALADQAATSRFLFEGVTAGGRLELKGQMVVTQMGGEDVLLFIGSPRLCNLDNLKAHGIYLCDLPLWDMGADFVLMAEQRQVEVDMRDRYETEANVAGEEARRNRRKVAQLQESLAQALAAQDGMRCAVKMDSPAEMALQLMEKIMNGDEVSGQEAFTVRMAILQAGANIFDPVNFEQQVHNISADDDVNQSLMELLSRNPAKSNRMCESPTLLWDPHAPASQLSNSSVVDATAFLERPPSLSSVDSEATHPFGLDQCHHLHPSTTHRLSFQTNGACDHSIEQPACDSAAFHSQLSPARAQLATAESASSEGHTASVVTGSLSLTASEGVGRCPAPGSTASLSKGLSSHAQQQPWHTAQLGPTAASLPVAAGAGAHSSGTAIPSPSACPFHAKAFGVGQANGDSATGVCPLSGPPLMTPASAAATAASRHAMNGRSSSSGGVMDHAAGSSVHAGHGGPAHHGNLGFQIHEHPEGHLLALLPSPVQSPSHARSIAHHRLSRAQPTETEQAARAVCRPEHPRAALASAPQLAKPLSSRTSTESYHPDEPASAHTTASASCSQVPAGSSSPALSRPHDHETISQHRKAVTSRGARAALHAGMDHPLLASRRHGSGNNLLHMGHEERLLQLKRLPPDRLAAALAKIDSWEFDAWALADASDGRPLSCLAFVLVTQRCTAFSRLRLSEERFARFMIKVEEGYMENPYHNRAHAADVMQTLHMVMTAGGVLQALAGEASSDAPSVPGQASIDTALLAAYLSAAVHDLGHKGLSNDYLCKVSDPLALLYNDRSPHENHHVAQTWRLLTAPDSNCNFLSRAPRAVMDSLRKMTIDMVLATDMKVHFSTTSLFTSRFAKTTGTGTMAGGSKRGSLSGSQQRLSKPSPYKHLDSPGGSAHHASMEHSVAVMRLSHDSSQSAPRRSTDLGTGDRLSVSRSKRFDVEEQERVPQLDDEGRALIMQIALKVSDLGHLCAPLPVHLKWVAALEEELFRQGDQEKAAGLAVSALMDRTKAGVTKSQSGFFNVVAMPLFSAFTSLFPKTQPLLDGVKSNYDYWMCQERMNR